MPRDVIEYGLYVDESGNFTQPGEHVVMVLGARMDALGWESAEKVWQIVSPGQSWRQFHATSLRYQAPARADALAQALCNHLRQLDVAGAFVWVTCRRIPRFDFYPLALVEALLDACSVVLNNTAQKITQTASSSDVRIEFKIHRACRETLNTLELEACLRERNTSYVGKLYGQRGFTGDQLSCGLKVHDFPCNYHPVTQMADSLGNYVRRQVAQLRPKVQRFEWALGLGRKLGRKNATGKNAGDLVSKLRSRFTPPAPPPPAPAPRIVTKIVTEPVPAPPPPPRPAVNPAEVIVAKVRDGRGREIEQAVLEFYRASALERQYGLLALATEARAEVKRRKYDLGLQLADLALRIEQQERQRKEVPSESLDAALVRAATVWLSVQNHHGRLEVDNEIVKMAEEASERLKGNPTHWEPVVELHNNIGVGLQNAFEFEAASTRIKPWVDYFFESLPAFSPPGVNLKAYYIGALFGTHAQNVAFAAHEYCLR